VNLHAPRLLNIQSRGGLTAVFKIKFSGQALIQLTDEAILDLWGELKLIHGRQFLHTEA